MKIDEFGQMNIKFPVTLPYGFSEESKRTRQPSHFVSKLFMIRSIQIRTHTHTYIHTYIHIYTHIYTYTYITHTQHTLGMIIRFCSNRGTCEEWSWGLHHRHCADEALLQIPAGFAGQRQRLLANFILMALLYQTAVDSYNQAPSARSPKVFECLIDPNCT